MTKLKKARRFIRKHKGGVHRFIATPILVALIPAYAVGAKMVDIDTAMIIYFGAFAGFFIVRAFALMEDGAAKDKERWSDD